MSKITFFPELFEHRSQALEALEAAGFIFLVDIKACDLLHVEFGVEITGVQEYRDARRIFAVLKKTFPEWRQGRIYLKDHGCDTGWVIQVHRFPEQLNESWRTGDGG